MAEFPMPEDAPQRYAELERAYVEERWSSVLGHGQTLLELLEASDDPLAEDLTDRVRVLMGHIHLYGLAEAHIAKDYYGAVLAGNAEPELKRIAAEGLRHCQRPAGLQASQAAASRDGAAEAHMRPAAEVATPAAAAEAAVPIPAEPAEGRGAAASTSDPFQAALASSSGSRPPAGPATPWLQQRPDEAWPEPAASEPVGQPAAEPASAPEATAGALAPRLEVEVVEEPELVEVAQADPDLAEELELELNRIRERRAAKRSQDQDPFDAAIAATAAGASRQPNQNEPRPSRLSEASAAAVAALNQQEPEIQAVEIAITPGTDRPPGSSGTAGEEAPPKGTTAAPDLSGEDPALVAGLLRVVLRS